MNGKLKESSNRTKPEIAATGGRIGSGILELDRMLGGNDHPPVEMGSTILIRGEPGSGKTTLAMQMLSHFLEASVTESDTSSRIGNLLSLEEDGRLLCSRMKRAYGFGLEDRLIPVGRNKPAGKQNLFCMSAGDIHDLILEVAAAESPDASEKGISTISSNLSSIANESLNIVACPNPVAAVLMAAAFVMRAPERAKGIVGALRPKHASAGSQEEATKKHSGSCLLVIDSLNAFWNIAAEHFDERRHPRIILHSFCRFLRTLFGNQITIVFTDEYHYQSTSSGMNHSESFYCDIEISLRPEPLRIPASYEPNIQAPVGYNLNALIDDTVNNIESRSFIRVMKSRGTPNQSRRCAYDIVGGQGIKLYPRYPGDGKLVLFAENQPQRDAWASFFRNDVPESYPALRTDIFDRMNLQNVFEGQRRLTSVPLKTDMYLASFDSYWVNWYRYYKLRTDIQRKLADAGASVGDIKVQELVNSIMRVLHGSTKPVKELTWKDVADFMSLSYFGELIRKYFNDTTWEEWIKELREKRRPPREVEDCAKTCSENSPFINTLRSFKRTITNSFLHPIRQSELRLFGDRRSRLIEELRYNPSTLQGDKTDENGDTDDELIESVPYDANLGIFVCRRDFLEHADLEFEDARGLIAGAVNREVELYTDAGTRLMVETIADALVLCIRKEDRKGSSFEDALRVVRTCFTGNKPLSQRQKNGWRRLLGSISEGKTVDEKQLTELVPECDLKHAEKYRIIFDVAKVTQEALRQRDGNGRFFILEFLRPNARGRRCYRFRVAPRNPQDLLESVVAYIGVCENTDAKTQLQDKLDTCLDRHFPEDVRTRDAICEELNEAMRIDWIRGWFRSRCDEMGKRAETLQRTEIAETLEMACRIHELHERLSNMTSAEMGGYRDKMVSAAAGRIAGKKLPKTWEEVIVVSRLLGRTVQIDWQTLDSFICSFLEVLWSCGGSSVVVDQDYQLRVGPQPRGNADGGHKHGEGWDSGFIQMLRACHIMHELYWQRIAPRSVVTTHKPRAFHRGVAGSRDWIFSRHWVSTFIELLTAKDDEGNLLYPDDPQMRLEIIPIPVSLTAWSEDLCKQDDKTRRFFRDCPNNYGCSWDEKYVAETDVADTTLATGAVTYRPRARKCSGDKQETECPGCPRPLSFSCWGEWRFGIVSGSENVDLAIDLINNMMGSIKILQRSFSGACVPTVEGFYRMYGELPLVNISERTEETLPRMTYNELRRTFFRTAKSRREIYDFRHCGKIIHSKLERIRKKPSKMDSRNLLQFSTEVFTEILALYSSYGRETGSLQDSSDNAQDSSDNAEG